MIRRAMQKDVPQIAALERDIFSSPWSAATLEDSLGNHCFSFFVAIEEDAVVAYSGMYTVADEGYVANIACHRDHRRKGLGKAVTTALISRGLELSLYSLSLEVRISNTPAISLYRALGFTEVGTRKNFYTKPTEDALIMTYYYKGGAM